MLDLSAKDLPKRLGQPPGAATRLGVTLACYRHAWGGGERLKSLRGRRRNGGKQLNSASPPSSSLSKRGCLDKSSRAHTWWPSRGVGMMRFTNLLIYLFMPGVGGTSVALPHWQVRVLETPVVNESTAEKLGIPETGVREQEGASGALKLFGSLETLWPWQGGKRVWEHVGKEWAPLQTPMDVRVFGEELGQVAGVAWQPGSFPSAIPQGGRARGGH